MSASIIFVFLKLYSSKILTKSVSFSIAKTLQEYLSSSFVINPRPGPISKILSSFLICVAFIILSIIF